MKNTNRPSKGLITEVNDMREMMRNLENRSSTSRLLTEQTGCDFGNGGCHPDCTCITIGFPAYNQTMMDLDTDCCCGNEIITINGCLPGPCVDNTDCNTNPGYHCCYADSGMAAIGFPSCNLVNDCYSYPSTNPGGTGTPTIEGCMDNQALNYDPNATVDTEECCYPHNSGCMMPGMINYDPANECDCNENWPPGPGHPGNVACCTTNITIPGGGMGGDHSGTETVTLGSLGWCFTDNSMVLMEDETTKPISEVEVGDMVKSEIGYSQVIGIDIHKGNFDVYSFNDKEAFVTEEHPFKTVDGWKAINPIETFRKHQVKSNILKEGDTIIKIDGKEEIKSIKKGETVDKVYNLLLDNEHVYYVNGYLVHNGKNVIGGTGVAPGGDPFLTVDDLDTGNKPPKGWDKPLPTNKKERER